MAQVRQSPAVQDYLQGKIDHFLDYELGAWQSVPEYAARWRDMDGIDKEAFHLHWKGVTEAYLRDLERWAEDGRLAPANSSSTGTCRRSSSAIAQR